MNIETSPIQLKATITYNAAADHFDAAPLGFWARHGRRAVELAALQAGDHVLDAGCGTGASALPAALAVGHQGRVLGLDVAESMLSRARDKAAARGLTNLEFRLADMSAQSEPDQSFDAVISVFSVFFVPDMERQITQFWRLLRPGGRLGGDGLGSSVFPAGGSDLLRGAATPAPGHAAGTAPLGASDDAFRP